MMGAWIEYAGAATAGAYLCATLMALMRPSILEWRPPLYAVAAMLVGFGMMRAVPDWAPYAAPIALIGATFSVVTARGALALALVVPFALAIDALAAASYLPTPAANGFSDASALLLSLPAPICALVALRRLLVGPTSPQLQT